MSSGVDRRDFFKIVSVGAAAGAACSTRVPEKIIPHVVPPDDQIPGEALWYATSCSECAAGCGMLVRNREGRAVKVEGNPEHPRSRGGLCARGHSTMQAQYHPDRYRRPLLANAPSTWEDVFADVEQALPEAKLAVVTGELGNGALAGLFDQLAATGTQARVVWEPLDSGAMVAAAERVFGRAVEPRVHFDQAGMVLSLGADFFGTWQNAVANTADWAKARKPREGRMVKLVQVSPRLGLTGANADEWLSIAPGGEVFVAMGLLARVLADGDGALAAAEAAEVRKWLDTIGAERIRSLSGLDAPTLDRLAKELQQQAPPLVIAGTAGVEDANATALHTAVLLLNKALGAVGKTISTTGRVPDRNASHGLAALRKLVAAIEAGEVDTVVVYGTNPVFTAPPELGVAAAFRKLERLISLDALPNETTALATAVLPDHGPLESWGDQRSEEGVWALRQPAMRPLWKTKAAGDTVIDMLRIRGAEPAAGDFLTALQADWRALYAERGEAETFEQFWEQAVQRGGVFDDVAPQAAALPTARLADLNVALPKEPSGLQAFVYPHIYRYDGRGANRGWLQEIPDPLVQAAWSNWVEIHPQTAKRLGLAQGDLAAVETEQGTIEVYVYPTSGVAKDVVGIPLGQGHSEAIGRFGSDVPGNPFTLLAIGTDRQTEGWVWAGTKVSLQKRASAVQRAIDKVDPNLVTTDGAKNDLDRGIAQVISLDTLSRVQKGEQDPPHKEHHGTHIEDQNAFYPPHEYPEHRWGMVVDSNACTGCGGCVAACYSENNIPVVGKESVALGREMAWLRIERYYEGDEADANTRFVPMMCQHCGNAPCEPVCPVVATYHNVDGLNGMVYNRCVGTRYCGNNCSYKVRRFNWFGWDDPKKDEFAWPEPMELMLNPDVTVRSKGVMEKCTFCVQRIRDKKETARLEGRPVKDGEVVPACAQSCPSDAIVFGDLKDTESKVSQLAAEGHRDYKVLEVLNTQPAVTYLKKVRWADTKA